MAWSWPEKGDAMKAIRVVPCMLSLLLLVAAGIAAAQSLYEEDRFQALTADRRALGVGDSLTVLVFENASASQSADTVTEKNAGISLGAGTQSQSYSAKISAGDQSTGKGRIQRTGRLAAQITVTVTGVDPNGELRVAGQQEIFTNGEKQLLELSGRVRPIDVSDINTIVSTRLADARITYIGDGILAEKQRQGVISRVLTWLGLL